ncbi:class I SAM-dependent methyltransferase [Pseudofrancisella aestuarii]|uniref:Ribosomal RNA small subunit methyltransferase J n=1 Tax=Pseudofrancisella aestuarii TaxID=2670347 RepID=A0ABV9TEM9_9GAMM
MIVLDKETQTYIKNINQNIDISINNHSEKFLCLENEFLVLHNMNQKLSIDFSSPDILERINPKTKKCNVIQAVEGRSKGILKILDTTAGLGRDAFTLASRGHSVIAIEKDTYIFLLLYNALERIKKNTHLEKIANRIELLNTDSCDFILKTNTSFDCVYLDPMFPERKKSAKVKKEMQIFHKIAFNENENNSELLEKVLIKKIAKKIIVKRPIKADFLANKQPTSQLKGKANRFDIYSI